MSRQLVILGGPRHGELQGVEDGRWTVQLFETYRVDRNGVQWQPETYDVAECASPGGAALMMPLGPRRWKVLVPSSIPHQDRDALLGMAERPVVDGGHRPETVEGGERGVCALCGQEMLRANSDGDAWHPWSVLAACPPEDDRRGFTSAVWGTSFRPGREHFRPVL